MFLKLSTMHKKMRIAVVSGFIPYPPVFGGAIDIWERIKGLHALGHTVDLIVTDKNNPTQAQLTEMALYTNCFFYARRQNKWQQLFFKLPLQMLSRKSLSSIQINKTYDLVILESEFCWPITLNKTINYKKCVVRVHNIEHHYFKSLGKSARTLKEKIYYKIEALKIKQFSTLIFNKVNKLWFISKDDLKRVNLPNKSVFIPFPINDAFISPEVKPEENVVFMGSLFMQNNIFGLDWYLQNVHPLLIKQLPKYHFYIIGSLKEDNPEIQKKYNNIPKVTFVVNTPCLKAFYQKASVFINPMFHGSGVKVKSVNALVNGLPLVSTAVGAEGIGLTNDMFFYAETTEEFTTQILNVFADYNTAIQKTLKAQVYLKQTNYLQILKNELNALS